MSSLRRSLNFLLLVTAIQCVVAVAQEQPPATTPAEGTPAEGAAGEEKPRQPDPKFLLEEMQVPTYEELLNGKPIDWVVLSTDEVYVVESIVPRPQTLEKRKQEVLRKEDERRTAAVDDRPRIIEELEDLKFLYVSLPNVEGNPERRLPLILIKEIIHHEDLMLRRVQTLLSEKNVQAAFELLLRLERNWENWPGLDVMHNQFLLVDGTVRVEQGNPLGALTVLRELYGRDAQFTGLAEVYGSAIDALVSAAVQADDYRLATFHLNDLTKRFANHPVFQKYDAQFSAQVRELIAAADAAATQQDYRTATLKVEEGARIWPRTPELVAAHRKHALRYQRLHVGTVDLPGQGSAFFLSTPADRRIRTLTTMSLFEVTRLRDGTAYYRTRFLDEWEPFDLGRRMKFTLRQFRQPSDMHNVIAAPDVVTQLLRMIDPDHPQHDERFASYVDSITVHSPQEFTLNFRRVPPRIEPLLTSVTFSADLTSEVSTEEGQSDPTLIGPLSPSGGFSTREKSDSMYALARALPEPDTMPAFHVAEVVERKFETHEEAMQALLRGEVALLPDLPDWVIRRVQADETFLQSFEVRQSRLPVVQVIQFNPATKVLRSRELRRGLEYAVDKETLLKEVVLKDPEARHGRIVTGPFFSDSPARHVLVEPRRYDVSSALAMVVAAKKVLVASKVIGDENLPRLRLIVEPGPQQMEVAKRIAFIWNRIGVPVEVVPGTSADTGEWDMMLRTMQMPEPLVEIWPFLTVSERASLEDLDDYPDWLKQEIVDLDRTSDQSRAIVKMQELHKHLWSDAALIPLWELDQFMVTRKTIKGCPTRPLHCYDEVDHWSVEPWYPVD